MTESQSVPQSEPLLVDARELACPMPLLKAKMALNGCVRGERVKVWATDAGSVRDFHAFTDLSSHSMIAFNEYDDYFEYVLEKGEPSEAGRS